MNNYLIKNMKLHLLIGSLALSSFAFAGEVSDVNNLYKSQSEVVALIKLQDDVMHVSKVTLNPNTATYSVKVLTQEGKVRFLSVDALR